nr:hypothetical protein [Segatella copri]
MRNKVVPQIVFLKSHRFHRFTQNILMIMGKYNLCKSVKSVGLKNNLWDLKTQSVGLKNNLWGDGLLRLVQVFEDEFYLVAGEVVEALALLGTINGGKQGGDALDPA